VLAIVIGLLSVLSLQALRLAGMTDETNVNIVLAHCIALVISALLVLYRRFPITIAFVYTAIISAAAFTESVEFYSVLIVGFLTIYSVGAWVSDRRLAFWTRLIVVLIQYTGSLVVVMLTSSSAELDAAEYEDIPVGITLYGLGTTFVLSLVYYVAAWYLGTRAWNRARDRWTLQKAYDELAQANQKVADAAVQAERLHIARELHDVIAHHVTVMGVHASAARRLVETGRETNAVVEQLEHIEASSAQAVQELQTMVYTLRDQDGSTEPLPDLRQLPELVRLNNTIGDMRSHRRTG
jgi:signal transduction histidine kinase